MSEQTESVQPTELIVQPTELIVQPTELIVQPTELIVIVGPTASGKSALAARLGAALGGEVISADSVQVYRHFDIGAGKPSPHELALCPHHLLGIRAPSEVLEAQQWAQLASERIEQIRAAGKVPIICGGTFLWIRALIFGLAEAPPGDAEIRARHRLIEQEKGREHLHQMLQLVDAESAERLHPNDFVRVSRALEVFELTGCALSTIQKEHGFLTPRYRTRLLAVEWPREKYEERLRNRVSAMIASGLVGEVRSLVEQGYAQCRAMGSVGYRQVYESLSLDPPLSEDELVQRIVQATRTFARRQRTWLRDEALSWVSEHVLEDDEHLAAEIKRLNLVGQAESS